MLSCALTLALHLTLALTPGSLQGEHETGGRVHTPSLVAPSVGRHQLNTARQLHLLTSPEDRKTQTTTCT